MKKILKISTLMISCILFVVLALLVGNYLIEYPGNLAILFTRHIEWVSIIMPIISVSFFTAWIILIERKNHSSSKISKILTVSTFLYVILSIINALIFRFNLVSSFTDSNIIHVYTSVSNVLPFVFALIIIVSGMYFLFTNKEYGVSKYKHYPAWSYVNMIISFIILVIFTYLFLLQMNFGKNYIYTDGDINIDQFAPVSQLQNEMIQ